MTTVITLSSIRGGVGKSSFAVELALYLGKKDKVLLIDADFYSPTLLHEINSRAKESIEIPKAFFRDFLREVVPLKSCVVDIKKNITLIFGDPNVNLWDLSKDVGTRSFWGSEDPSRPSASEVGMKRLRDFLKENNYKFIIFDLMGGLSFPMVFFSYISNFPVLLSRTSVPQISDILGFINLIGREDRPVNILWSNVPDIDDYMEDTRQDLERRIDRKHNGLFRILGVIPRDDAFEQNALIGNLTLETGINNSPYYIKLQDIAKNLIRPSSG